MTRHFPMPVACFLATMLAAGAVAANPMIVCGTNACQVTGTLHAQVSYFCDGGPECKAPSATVQRNGETITVAWQGPTGISVNGGSGVTTFQAYQFCDCEVGTGSLEYVLDLGDAEYCAGDTSTTLYPVVTAQDIGVSVAEVAQDVPAAGDVAAVSDVVMPQDMGDDVEVAPWDEPAPPWPKGLDCVQWCKDNPKNPDVSPEVTTVPSDAIAIDTASVAEIPTSSETGAAVEVATSTEVAASSDQVSSDNANQEKPADSSSTCSVSTTTVAAAALPALLLLVLPLFAFVPARRRRD